MALFKCGKCGCKENTALCNFHLLASEWKTVLCSECDPLIGKWHNKFNKKPFKEPYSINKHGFIPHKYRH